MKIEQKQWTLTDGWNQISSTEGVAGASQLVLAFGGRVQVQEAERFKEIRAFYPNAHILMCSTAGEILDTMVRDETISVTAVAFDSTQLAFASAQIETNDQSNEVGQQLAKELSKENLVHAMVFSDGLHVNGTALVEGITSQLPENVSITGGLVGDGADFKHTVVGLDAVPTEGNVILVGFYGDALQVGYGSLGGWDAFGPERTITRSENNVLFELDGKPALELYKEYLGDQAEGLPGTGLKFPIKLGVHHGSEDVEVVRTLLAVDEEAQSMTFAGDMPEGAQATLMKANFERLVDGAAGAATMSGELSNGQVPDLAILISCVGRKLVLKDGVEEETEAVRGVLGKGAYMTGFYSYGEISPVAATEKQCRLHNQTMTITTFKEN